MDFKRTWTRFAVEAERVHFGVARIVKAHNEQIATLQSQLAASQERIKVLETLLEAEVHPENLAISAELEISLERERILREGLSKIILLDEDSGWPYEVGDYEQGIISGREEAADIARATIKAAAEVTK